MTRLKTSDIEHIESNLIAHDAYLVERTGHTLAEIAAAACGSSPSNFDSFIKAFLSLRIAVVPVTAGLGVIITFAESVCAILRHMGFPAEVTKNTDAAGMAEAFEKGFDAVMMSDDDRFVALNLHNRKVVDNSETTGRAFAMALHLMVKKHNGKGLKEKETLIMGCGPVGSSAAATLCNAGARVALYDINPAASKQLQEQLIQRPPSSFFTPSIKPDGGVTSAPIITVEDDFEHNAPTYHYILEATPKADTLTESDITPASYVATPGVPLGVSAPALKIITDRHLIHDTLELGVAVMAASLFI